jgi:hypothetical protein
MQTQPVEKVMGLAQAAIRIKELTGYKPSRSTMWRWIQAGRIQTRRIGTRYYTNETWIADCIACDQAQRESDIIDRFLEQNRTDNE